MTPPIQLPGPSVPDPGHTAGLRGRAAGPAGRATAACLAVVLGTLVLAVAAGFLWHAVAPRPLLVMTGRGAAEVVNAETNAFIAADGWYSFICLACGVLTGLAGYLVTVRRHGPVAMLAVLASALAAAWVAAWVGEHVGLASYHHLLATLPVGAQLHAALTLGARTAIVFWPLGTGLMAGGLVLAARVHDRQMSAAASSLAAD